MNIYCYRVLIFLLSSLWKISREGELRLLSAEIDMIFFSSMLQRGPNPIFSPHVTQPNLCLQFDAHDSVNGVTGQNTCTVHPVMLTDKDPIAWACEKVSYLWMCELYINEI